jgi:uncharacterized protein YehS (DUF1456 family)
LTNNDVLRRIRYIFNYNDNKIIDIFASGDLVTTREQISGWLKKEDDEGYEKCRDMPLAAFLNGFINVQRGQKEGAKTIPEKKLTNNIILTKLKIAFSLKAEEIIELLATENLTISKPELSAFSRKPDHKHYRECKDQFLRNFLQALGKIHHIKRRAPQDVADKASNSLESHSKNEAVYYEKNSEGVREKKYVKDKKAPKERSKEKPVHDEYFGTAKPNASKPYVNANATVVAKPTSGRKVLKLKSEDIWGKDTSEPSDK